MAGIAIPFLLTVVAVALALRLLNGLPAQLQRWIFGPPEPRFVLSERLQYPTIEAAEAELGVKVGIPSYFPSRLVWPPASVRGQREPARVVSLLFRSNDGEQALQIREIFWPGDELPFPVPEPMEVIERRVVEIHGAGGQLLLGRGQDDVPVNQLRWRTRGVHLVVTTVFPPEELLKIGKSIHMDR